MANILFPKIINLFLFYCPTEETSVPLLPSDNKKNGRYFVEIPGNGINPKSTVYIPKANW